MKKHVSILMVVMFLAAMVSACAPGSSKNPVNNTANEGGTEPTSTAQKAKLTFATFENWHGTAKFADNLPVLQEIEKRTGVEVEFQTAPSGNEYTTTIRTRLAAGTGLPDLVKLPDGAMGVSQYSSNKVIVPLDEYLTEEIAPDILRLFRENEYLKAYATSPDGKIYALPDYVADVNTVVPDWISYRHDWLEKLGLPEPKTTEDLYKMLKAFKEEDPNGNGKADEIPLAHYGLIKLKFLMTGFGFTTNADWDTDENGKVVYNPVDPKFKDFLTEMNKWYEEGLIYEDAAGSGAVDYVTRNQVGMFSYGASDNVLMNFDSLAQATDPNADYRLIPLPVPVGYTGEKPVLAMRNPVWEFTAVTKDAKDVEAAVRWMNYVWASDEGEMLRYYGIEGQTYEMVDGKPQYTEFVTNNPGGEAPISVLRSIGAWQNFLIRDKAEPFLNMFKGTKVEDAYNQFAPMGEAFPSPIGTQEENTVYTQNWPDLQTYMDEKLIAFITGAEPIENFDKYVETANSMGLQKIIEVKQAQYDRFNSYLK